jgi:hypothetical protein
LSAGKRSGFANRRNGKTDWGSGFANRLNGRTIWASGFVNRQKGNPRADFGFVSRQNGNPRPFCPSAGCRKAALHQGFGRESKRLCVFLRILCFSLRVGVGLAGKFYIFHVDAAKGLRGEKLLMENCRKAAVRLRIGFITGKVLPIYSAKVISLPYRWRPVCGCGWRAN